MPNEGPLSNKETVSFPQISHDDSHLDQIEYEKNFIDIYKGFASQNRLASEAPPSNGVSTAALPLNPALLLNPKGYTGPSRPIPASDTTNNYSDPGGAGFLDFQFSSPNDGTGSSASTPSSFLHGTESITQSHASTPVNGFGAMFERMNNVQERVSMPQPKRRRVEAEDDTINPSGFGSSSGGVLGQYVKDKREEAAKNPALERVDTVDLTTASKSRNRVVPREQMN